MESIQQGCELAALVVEEVLVFEGLPVRSKQAAFARDGGRTRTEAAEAAAEIRALRL